MITLYGIKNCDTVRKACKWLDAQGVAYTFHDFRQDGLTSSQVASWLEQLPLDTLINKRSTTWKGFSDEEKVALNESTAPQVCEANVTLIKRPVLDTGLEVITGFNEKAWQTLLKEAS